MKALIALAVAITGAPALAVAADDNEQASTSERERKICTRIQLRGASRMPYRRVCLTEAEWRDRLGPDWRQHLAGNQNPEDDMDAVDTRARAFTDVPVAQTPL